VSICQVSGFEYNLNATQLIIGLERGQPDCDYFLKIKNKKKNAINGLAGWKNNNNNNWVTIGLAG
jgi:hypothetical protein